MNKEKGIITICGSMRLKDNMFAVGKKLEQRGFTVLLPNLDEVSDYAELSEVEQVSRKNRLIKEHLEKIRLADAVLIVNERAKEIDGYIGANSFLEIGFAFCLGKKIFLFRNIPSQPNSVEIAGMLPEILEGDLDKLVI